MKEDSNSNLGCFLKRHETWSAFSVALLWVCLMLCGIFMGYVQCNSCWHTITYSKLSDWNPNKVSSYLVSVWIGEWLSWVVPLVFSQHCSWRPPEWVIHKRKQGKAAMALWPSVIGHTMSLLPHSLSYKRVTLSTFSYTFGGQSVKEFLDIFQNSAASHNHNERNLSLPSMSIQFQMLLLWC